MDIPLLHKEFIVSEYQLLQGRVRGASASFILAVYNFDEKELREIVLDYKCIGLVPVVDYSLEKELSSALSVNPDILIINSCPIAALSLVTTRTYKAVSQ